MAVDGGEVVGFLSAFLVPKPTPRWEPINYTFPSQTPPRLGTFKPHLFFDSTNEYDAGHHRFLVPKPTPRWEIDLIIVRSTSRENGIGASLIEEALTYGSHLGARWAMASIRIDNYASQRTFSKAGFATDAQVRSLFLWDPLACQSAINVLETVHLIPVANPPPIRYINLSWIVD